MSVPVPAHPRAIQVLRQADPQRFLDRLGAFEFSPPAQGIFDQIRSCILGGPTCRFPWCPMCGIAQKEELGWELAQYTRKMVRRYGAEQVSLLTVSAALVKPQGVLECWENGFQDRIHDLFRPGRALSGCQLQGEMELSVREYQWEQSWSGNWRDELFEEVDFFDPASPLLLNTAVPIVDLREGEQVLDRTGENGAVPVLDDSLGRIPTTSAAVKVHCHAIMVHPRMTQRYVTAILQRDENFPGDRNVQLKPITDQQLYGEEQGGFQRLAGYIFDKSSACKGACRMGRDHSDPMRPVDYPATHQAIAFEAYVAVSGGSRRRTKLKRGRLF
jgi:hypothetical protein